MYSIGSRESFELFHTIKESILRIKDTDHFPFLIIGFGNVSMERNVSTAEGQRVADRANCKFQEIMRTKDIEPALLNFVKETISFSALREKDNEEEENKASEQFIVSIYLSLIQLYNISNIWYVGSDRRRLFRKNEFHQASYFG